MRGWFADSELRALRRERDAERRANMFATSSLK